MCRNPKGAAAGGTAEGAAASAWAFAVADAAARVLPIVALLMPLAPCGSALEGALLGSMRVLWVGGRTVAGCGLTLGLLALARAADAGLLGVWAASSSLLFFNALADAWLLNSRWSPLKDGAKLD